MDEMRALLDSLMGADRNNLNALQQKSRKSFKDPEVCHFYILDFCPHDLFPNTKSDIGACPNKHSDSFKEQFLLDPDHEYYKWIYEEEFIERLQRLIGVVEQRIRKGNERILGPDEQQMEREREKKLDVLRAEVSAILKLAEEAGEMGNIPAAEAHTSKANELRRNIDSLSVTPLKQISAQEKSLRVCETCGAMQSTGDAASRFESHIAGKQHVGYELIRATLATLREKHANGTAPSLNSGKGVASKRGRSAEKPVDIPRTEADRPSEPVNGELTTNKSREYSRSPYRRRSGSRRSMSQNTRRQQRQRSPGRRRYGRDDEGRREERYEGRRDRERIRDRYEGRYSTQHRRRTPSYDDRRRDRRKSSDEIKHRELERSRSRGRSGRRSTRHHSEDRSDDDVRKVSKERSQPKQLHSDSEQDVHTENGGGRD